MIDGVIDIYDVGNFESLADIAVGFHKIEQNVSFDLRQQSFIACLLSFFIDFCRNLWHIM